MYRDNADWRVYFGLINAPYHKHPIHIDIAGTADSIRQIDKEKRFIAATKRSIILRICFCLLSAE